MYEYVVVNDVAWSVRCLHLYHYAREKVSAESAKPKVNFSI